MGNYTNLLLTLLKPLDTIMKTLFNLEGWGQQELKKFNIENVLWELCSVTRSDGLMGQIISLRLLQLQNAKTSAALKMKTKLDLDKEYLFNTHSHRHKNTLREALLNEK